MLVKIGGKLIPIIHHYTREDITIRADKVRVHDIVVFRVEIPYRGCLVPNLVGG